MNHAALSLFGLALLPPAVQADQTRAVRSPKSVGARSLKRSIYTSRGTANELLRGVQTSDSRMYGSYTASPVGSPCPYCELQ
jgi:hypothetical protein